MPLGRFVVAVSPRRTCTDGSVVATTAVAPLLRGAGPPACPAPVGGEFGCAPVRDRRSCYSWRSRNSWVSCHSWIRGPRLARLLQDLIWEVAPHLTSPMVEGLSLISACIEAADKRSGSGRPPGQQTRTLRCGTCRNLACWLGRQVNDVNDRIGSRDEREVTGLDEGGVRARAGRHLLLKRRRHSMILGPDQRPRRDAGLGRRTGRLDQLRGGGRAPYCAKHRSLVWRHAVREQSFETGVRRIWQDA